MGRISYVTVKLASEIPVKKSELKKLHLGVLSNESMQNDIRQLPMSWEVPAVAYVLPARSVSIPRYTKFSLLQHIQVNSCRIV